MKNVLVFVFVMGIMFAPVSCKKKEDTPEDPPDTQQLELSPKTKVVPEDAGMAIMDIDSSYTFTVMKGNSYFDGLQVGDIMVAGVSDKAKYGYLRRITAITANGDALTTIQTRQATLSEAFKVGKIHFHSGQLKMGQIQEIHLAKGVHLKNRKNPDFTVFDFDIDTDFPVGNTSLNLKGNSQLTMDLFFDFDWSVEFDLDWIPVTINVDLFKTGVDVDQSSSIKVNTAEGIEVNSSKELATFVLSPIVFFAGPVPVVFIPTVSLNADINGQISSSVSLSAAEHFTGELGVKYDGDWSGIAEKTFNTDFSAPQLEAAADVKASVGPLANLLLYGVVGPYAKAGGCVGLEASPTAQNWNLDMNVGANYNVGIQVDVLGFSEDWSISDEPLCLFQVNVMHLEDEPFDDAIYITSPDDNAHITTGSELLIKTFYTGATPDEVRFLIDGTQVLADDTEPFEYNWNTEGVALGEHSIKVIEIIGGNEVSGDEATLTITNPQWEEQNLVSNVGTDGKFYDVFFLNDQEGWVTASQYTDGYILHTSDGGNTWSAYQHSWELFNTIAFVSPGEGVSVGLGGTHLFKITGSGSDVEEFGQGIPVADNYVLDKNLGLSAQVNGINLTGMDNDGNFSIIRTGFGDEQIAGITPIVNSGGATEMGFAGNKGILSVQLGGDNKVMITNDGGVSWQDYSLTALEMYDEIKNICVFNNDVIWMAGTHLDGNVPPNPVGAFVAVSNDGGINWQRISVPQATGFTSVAVVSTTEAYASVGYDSQTSEPKLYYTEDGGLSWQAITEVSGTKALTKVVFKGTDFGYAIGYDGVAYRYTNVK